MLPKLHIWVEAEGDIPVHYAYDVGPSPVGWERYSTEFSSATWPIETERAMFWVCESGGIHETRVTSFTCAYEGTVRTAMALVRDVGGDSSVADCRCTGSPGPGWGGEVLGEIPWQGPGVKVGVQLGLGLERFSRRLEANRQMVKLAQL